MKRGYLLPLLVVAMTVAFAAWALSTPPIEQVWVMHQDLRVGERPPLTASERDLFQSVLDRHPELIEMVEGQHAGIASQHRVGRVDHEYAYLLRAAGGGRRLHIRYAYPKKKAEIEATVRVRGLRLDGKITPRRPWTVELPEAVGTELLEIRLQEQTNKGKAKRPSVQIDVLPEDR